MKGRILGLYIFFVIILAAVTVRLFSLQVLSHEVYENLAKNQHKLYRTLVPIRGEIFVREGKNGKTVFVITNVEKNLVFVVPPEIIDKEKTASSLAKVLALPKAEILEKIFDEERKWVSIKKELPENVSEAITKLDLKGIYLQSETYRLYPEKNFASQVLGFLGYDGDKRIGRYGLEEYFEKPLAGEAGSLILDKDIKGRWIAGGVRKIQEARNGVDIVLTLDRAILF